ncbi:MAG: STAS domain-containing protein [bacterium]
MAFQIRQEDAVTVVEMSGEFWGGEETKKLSDAFKRFAAAGHVRVVIDMEQTTYLNSPSIGVLMRLHTTVAGKAGKVVLANVSKRNLDFLEMTNLTLIFQVFASAAEGVEALKAWSPAAA